MTWKKGNVKFDDGSIYPAEMSVVNNGQVRSLRVQREDGKVVGDINPQYFASQLNKKAEDIYPMTYDIQD